MQTEFHDDEFDPTQYADASPANIFPSPGNYVLKATSIGPAKNPATGQPLVANNAAGEPVFRTLQINRVEVVEPEEEEGIQFGLFARLGTKPFVRQGKQASKAVDALRAINVQLTTDLENWASAYDVLEQELAAGEQFAVQLGYTAKDITAAKAELEANPGLDDEGKRAVWRAHTYYTKDFKNGDGTYKLSILGKTGALLEAKPAIDRFHSSTKKVKLGPFRVKS